MQLYPEYSLNEVYIQRAIAYQERIKVLQGAVGPAEPQAEAKGVEGAKAGEEKKASYEDLIVKEKPNVKWDEVIGLDVAKKAIKEAIIYPFQRPDLFPPWLA